MRLTISVGDAVAVVAVVTGRIRTRVAIWEPL
jgi:hypothetical protein